MPGTWINQRAVYGESTLGGVKLREWASNRTKNPYETTLFSVGACPPPDQPPPKASGFELPQGLDRSQSPVETAQPADGLLGRHELLDGNL